MKITWKELEGELGTHIEYLEKKGLRFTWKGETLAIINHTKNKSEDSVVININSTAS